MMSVATELKYTVSLNSGAPLIVLPKYLYTGDQQAHRIHVTCTRGGEAVDLAGATIPAYFIRADGATVILTGKVENNQAVVELPATCYAIAGRFSLVIKAVMGGATSTILALQGAVSRSQTDALVDPGDVLPSLDELLAQVQKVEEAVAKAEAIANMEVTVETLPTGSDATADYEVGKLHLGIPAGDQGPQGKAATVQIGAVNTLPAGSSATVNNGGTDTAAILNFGIPQGPQGEQGVGITMMQTSKSDEDGGENTITFILSDGTSKKFTVQNGSKGTPGEDGQDGQAATIRIGAVSTKPAGTAATVTNGGTANAAVLNFGIPMGQQGETGQRGSKLLKVTTSPTSYTTTIGGFKPSYRMPLSAVLNESGSDDVQVGDVVWRSYYHYPVGYVDDSYVYLGAYVSIRGASGATGATGPQGATGETGNRGYSVFFYGNTVSINPDGYYEINPAEITLPIGMDVGDIMVGDMVIGWEDRQTQQMYLYRLDSYDSGYYLTNTHYKVTGDTGKTPVKGTDYFTAADKTEMVGQVKAAMPTFTLVGTDENDVQHTWTLYGVQA